MGSRLTLILPILQRSLVELAVLGCDVHSRRMGIETQEPRDATVGEGCVVWSACAVHCEVVSCRIGKLKLILIFERDLSGEDIMKTASFLLYHRHRRSMMTSCRDFATVTAEDGDIHAVRLLATLYNHSNGRICIYCYALGGVECVARSSP